MIVKIPEKELKSCINASLKVSFVVGTTLSMINQSDAVIKLAFGKEEIVKIFFNFLIPFLVSSYSRISLLKEIFKGESGNE